MNELVYLNGEIVTRDEARVSVLDHGFLYGLGLFETLRVYAGRPFLLERHVARLKRSAQELGIAIDDAALYGAVTTTIKVNQLYSARLRITVSAGEGDMVPDPATCQRPTVLVMAREYKPPPETVYESGYRAIIVKLRRYSLSPLSRLKTANYLEPVLARRQARAAGADEAICLDERGFVLEASMSNVFVVSAGMLITPAYGMLPGVTREAVMELARDRRLVVNEREVTPEELLVADEAFLTNSMIEVMPLATVDGKPIGSGGMGPITRAILTNYRALVAARPSG